MELAKKLLLPCGTILPNRLGKSAMSENMASKDHIPGLKFFNAYSQWAQGGTGLLISGNVMVDSQYRGEANNVVIEKGCNNHKELKSWACSCEGTESQLWIQLNHPGKQTPKFLTKVPVAPSSIPLKSPLDAMFNQPRELAHEEILDIIGRFAYAAKICKETGFHGVQIHGAHGYLISQFLSKHHNQRTDEWGGSAENRLRFVREIYKAIRHEVGPKYPIGIKMNSADFSKGGFDHEEAIHVAKTLSDLGIDLIEISGGSYEKPAMTGSPIKESTIKREAYFIEYAKEIKAKIACPIMVTGGFRTREFMEESLKKRELDIIGLARPLCINPNFSNQLLSGEDVVSEVKPLSSGIKIIDTIFPLEIIWYTMQINRMGENKKPCANASVYLAIFNTALDTGMQSLRRVRGKS
ncbi:MAG: NADH:flavin oxidoreductase/NADH oxidase family protein [Bacteriovoracaceae bacterium]|jgi:2,4-dienoyl-CoA reductase-like NADH-dependent reductase (Old Yellow Enzyme family)|nr:NADH:flavin oxidoreductase/NADH oxidase family protein [Bacteriovoracaceae bacterium]